MLPQFATTLKFGARGALSRSIDNFGDDCFFADTGLEVAILALSELTKFGGVSRDLVAI